MELYTLDSNFLKAQVVDEYISAIWTERYTDSGDFVVSLPATTANRELLSEGTVLAISDSDELMLAETQEIKDNILKVTGFTLEKEAFENRVVIPADDVEQLAFIETASAGATMAQIVFIYATASGWAVYFGATLPLDIDCARQAIPNLVTSNGVVGGSSDFSIKRGTIMEQVKQIGQTANIGWKLTLENVTSAGYTLRFHTYNGKDRTSVQSTYPIVRFSPTLDSLTEVKELRSITGYRTVAYAISPGFDPLTLPVGSPYTGKAYAYPTAEFETGWARRTILVEISGITIESVNNSLATYQEVMDTHAKNALANNNFTKVLDGEVVPQSAYQYGTDYFLGDLVELQDPSGYIQTARVTEYIRTQDVNGAREYPTVSVIE